MRKIRWKARFVGGLIALTGLGLAGCKTQLFLEPADWKEAKRPNIPESLEKRPHDPIVPPIAQAGAKPATVNDSARTTRALSLKEAMAIAIEQGNRGSLGLDGREDPNLVGYNGQNAGGTDTIKAFVLDPAIAQVEVERSLSKFDARWISSLSWAKQDQATLSLQQSFSNGDSASLTSTLAKPLPTGGIAGITTSINYLNLASAPTNSQFIALNTSYTPRVQFIFEQPLLQGFGIEANQLLPGHPGSTLIPGLRPSGGGNEGILITRVRTEQAKAQFDTTINQLLVNVEQAYWNLYSAYYNKYAQEVGLEQAFGLYNTLSERVKTGLTVSYLRDQAEAQYWLFRQQVVTARQQVLDADRALRGLLGMKSNDGTVFIPADAPLKAPFTPDIDAVYQEALQTRPELMIARQEVKALQLNLLAQKNLRRPDLRFFSSYDVNALGQSLTGESPDNALGNLRMNQFNSWQVGLRLDMPLGFRDANSSTRQAQLRLWKSYEYLRDSERKVFDNIVEAVRQMELGYATNTINEARSKALLEVVRQQNSRLGNIKEEDYIGQLNGLIQSQRDLATAISDQYRGLANYNAALARLEYMKGTIQAYNNVSVADGPLPAFVQKKAADHFRALSSSIKLREHPADGPGIVAPHAIDPMQSFSVPPGPQSAPMVAPRGGNLPGLLPPPKPMPLTNQPAATTTKSWDVWQTQPSNSGVSVPGTLPTLSPTPTVGGEGTGNFKQNGSVTLPLRPTPGVTPIAPTPPATLSGPTTPILQIPPR